MARQHSTTRRHHLTPVQRGGHDGLHWYDHLNHWSHTVVTGRLSGRSEHDRLGRLRDPDRAAVPRPPANRNGHDGRHRRVVLPPGQLSPLPARRRAHDGSHDQPGDGTQHCRHHTRTPAPRAVRHGWLARLEDPGECHVGAPDVGDTHNNLLPARVTIRDESTDPPYHPAFDEHPYRDPRKGSTPAPVAAFVGEVTYDRLKRTACCSVDESRPGQPPMTASNSASGLSTTRSRYSTHTQHRTLQRFRTLFCTKLEPGFAQPGNAPPGTVLGVSPFQLAVRPNNAAYRDMPSVKAVEVRVTRFMAREGRS